MDDMWRLKRLDSPEALDGECRPGTHHSAGCVEAGMLPEGLIHASQQVSDQPVVASKGPGHQVLVHEHIPDSTGRKAHHCQQAIL